MPLSIALYNAILLFAHAATAAMAQLRDIDDMGVLVEELRKVSFSGKGGNPVILDECGDPIQDYEVLSYMVETSGEAYRGMTFTTTAAGFERQVLCHLPGKCCR